MMMVWNHPAFDLTGFWLLLNSSQSSGWSLKVVFEISKDVVHIRKKPFAT